MEFGPLVIKFVLLMMIVCVPLIFMIRWAVLNSTSGALKHVQNETEQARIKQGELDVKIKEANEELAKRRAEADALAKKMITEAEDKAKEEREKLINKARAEGEEIITKAQGTKDKLRKEIEKEFSMKSIDFSMQLLGMILTEQAKGILSNQLSTDFIESLKKVDMSRIAPDVSTADVVTANELDQKYKDEIAGLLSDKLKRPVQVSYTLEPQIIGGMVLKFGSLALDGSLQNLIKDAAVVCKQKAEAE